jgi:hypothetical protein
VALAGRAALCKLAVLATLLAAALFASPSQPDEDYAFEEEGAGRLRVGAWGGTLFDLDEQGTIPFAGGEVGWSFGPLGVGVLAQAYRFGRERADSEWGPVVLGRLEQRFETGRGAEAALAFGVGGARLRGWQAWFQFGFGFRARRGPVYFGGELGFEQEQLFRLGATLGLAAF